MTNMDNIDSALSVKIEELQQMQRTIHVAVEQSTAAGWLRNKMLFWMLTIITCISLSVTAIAVVGLIDIVKNTEVTAVGSMGDDNRVQTGQEAQMDGDTYNSYMSDYGFGITYKDGKYYITIPSDVKKENVVIHGGAE